MNDFVSCLIDTDTLFENIGLIIAACVNNATSGRDDTGCYRIPVAVQILFGFFLAAGMLLLPETPRYLIKSDQHDKALASLGYLQGLPIDHPYVIDDFNEILSNLEFERSNGTGYLGCWRQPFLKRQLTGCILQALQQLSGSQYRDLPYPALANNH